MSADFFPSGAGQDPERGFILGRNGAATSRANDQGTEALRLSTHLSPQGKSFFEQRAHSLRDLFLRVFNESGVSCGDGQNNLIYKL
jgi:hypothetical protein